MGATVTNGYIATPTTGASPMASSFWVRATGSIPNMAIHGRHAADGQASDGFYIIFSGSGSTLTVASKSGTTSVIGGSGTASVRDGNWHHIGFNYPQTSGTTVELYVDGVLDFSQTAGSAHGGVSFPIRFGSVASTFFGLTTTCDLAEMAVWNTLLTASEMASLARGFRPSDVKRNGLLYYVPSVRDIQEVLGGTLATQAVSVVDHPRVY